MPYKLRTLSGDQMAAFLSMHGFILYKITGSHMKIVRKIYGEKQVLLIPRNRQVPKGTTKAIYNQAKRFVHERSLRDFFYTK